MSVKGVDMSILSVVFHHTLNTKMGFCWYLYRYIVQKMIFTVRAADIPCFGQCLYYTIQTTHLVMFIWRQLAQKWPRYKVILIFCVCTIFM